MAWDPEQSSSVAGYMVYYGQASGSYASKLDAGLQTSLQVSNLAEGAIYYYAVTAYDGSRIESGYSNEASAVVPYSAPIANFSSNVSTGAAPLAVTFASTSSGTITGYSWNFGDGSSSAVQNSSHTYSAAGVYSVSLTVTGPGGSNTNLKSGYVTVDQAVVTAAPVANFTVDKTSGLAPLTVYLTSTSSGSINSYSWTFGDGTSSTAQNPSHTYSSTGTYSVALTVTGPGGSNTVTRGSYITVTSAVARRGKGHNK